MENNEIGNFLDGLVKHIEKTRTEYIEEMSEAMFENARIIANFQSKGVDTSDPELNKALQERYEAKRMEKMEKTNQPQA